MDNSNTPLDFYVLLLISFSVYLGPWGQAFRIHVDINEKLFGNISIIVGGSSEESFGQYFTFLFLLAN